MKTKYYIIFSFLVLLSFSGCQKLDEDPKALLSPDTYFKTQSDLDASVTAVYTSLARSGNYEFTNRMVSCFGSDDLTTDPALNKGNLRAFDQLNGSSTTADYSRQWTGMWAGIYQCNSVIANYGKVQNSTEDLKNAAAAQAYFIRAWCYFMLVRTFGQTPIILVPTSVDARVPREEVSKVYAQIVSDLGTAISMFPANFSTAPNRANPLASKALLASVYLSMTGWPLNDAANYTKAAAAANEVIQAKKYTLVADYAKVFTTNNNSEAIFAFQFNVTGGYPMRWYGSSSIPLDEVAQDKKFGGNGNSGWDDFYPEINFFKNAPKCYRSVATFHTTIKVRNPDKETFTLYPWFDKNTHAMHPYYKKFRYGLGVPGNGDGMVETDTKIISMNPSTNKTNDIIRYPMPLLVYAEASAMAAGAPTTASYDAINMVRQRAGLPNLTPGLSATAFRDSVVRERAYEFAGENGERWWDIVRLQLLPKIISERDPTENPIPPSTAADPKNRYLAPVPFNEMSLNPAWAQNPGY